MTAPARRIHPVSRLLTFIAALIALTCFNDPRYVAAPALITFGVALFACRAYKAVWKLTPLAIAFLTLSLVMWPPFIREGTPVFSFYFYVATEKGLLYGAAIGVRIVAMLFAGVAFLGVTTPEEFNEALRALRFPGPAAVTLSLSFRLLPVMFETGVRALEAQRARGLEFGKNFFSQARHILTLVVPVFLHGLRTADRLAASLELKGFGKGRPPTIYRKHVASTWDWAVPTAAIAATALAVALRCLGNGAVLPDRL